MAKKKIVETPENIKELPKKEATKESNKKESTKAKKGW